MRHRSPLESPVLLRIRPDGGSGAGQEEDLVSKPDNVLLRREPGGVLVAKVADFGLARADVDTLDPEPRGPDSELIALARNSVLSQGMTRVDAVVGTPLYMSPEQHVAGSIDARSDQFSFCVALFAALYGKHPYDGDTLEQLARGASSPRRPAPPVGSRVPKWLHRLCLRGMQPDRAARFPDMGALLAEVDRRHGRVGRVGLAIFGSLAVGITLAIGLASRGPAIDACGGGPARMQGVWDASVQIGAERAFGATGAVYAGDAWTATRAQIDVWKGEWLRMHRDSCEATARGEQSSGRLDLRMQCLERRRQELAALTDLYVHADKQVVRGAFDAALALPAVDGCQDPPAPGPHVDPPPADRLDAIEAARGLLATSRSLRTAGKTKDALARAREASDVAAAIPYAPLHAEVQLALGTAQLFEGEYEPAIPTLADAVGSALHVGDDARLFDGLLHLMTITGAKLGRDKEAAAWDALARGVLARTGAAPRDEADLLFEQANVDLTAARFTAAAARLERAVSLLTAVYGPDSPHHRHMLNSLGLAYLRSGRIAEGQSMVVRAIAIGEAASGPNHPELVFSLNNLAYSYERHGRYAETIAVLRRAQAILSENSGPDHPTVGMLRHNIASMLRARGDLVNARLEADESVRILEAKLGPEHPTLAGALAARGEIRLESGDLPGARADLQRADDMHREILGPDHPARTFGLLGLGRVALAEDRPADALAPLELGLRLFPVGEGEPDELGQLHFALARALWSTSDRPRATTLLTEARAELLSAGAPGLRHLAELDRWLADHPA